MTYAPYTKPIRIVLADDHPLFLEIFERTLKKSEEIEIVGQATNGNDLIQCVEKELPDLVITDLRMPAMDGIQATYILKKKFPDVRVIALSVYTDEGLIVQMIESGADGFLVKSSLESEIFDAIKRVYYKGTYYCATISGTLAKVMLQSKSHSLGNGENHLTEKEVQIIRLICQEFSSKEIASKLNIPVRTVESTRERIQEKIGAKNMVGIVTYAIRHGIYDPK